MKLRKVIAAALCAAMALTGSAGCLTASAAEGTEKVLNVGWSYEPSSLDPARGSEDASYSLINIVGETLLRNVENVAQPGIAESYETNDDNTEYTFHLREDAVYSDGTPVTANDFAYAFKRLLDTEGAYENAEGAYIIKNAEAYYNGEAKESDLGIEVVDDHTLKLTLESPTYPLSFTAHALMPINQAKAEECGITYGAEAENILTNGPFTVTSWTHDSEVVLEKNENYWNADAIKLDKIVLKLNAKGDTAVDMLLAGELDVANMDSQVQADTLMASGFSSLTFTGGVEDVHINHAGSTEETGLFLSNTNFRKALSYAIDRNALVATAYTTDVAATRVVGPNEAGVDAAFVEEYPYEGWSASADAEKAKECLQLALDELGKTADEIPTFSILCYDSNTNMLAMNAVMDMWSQTLGISCQIDAQPLQNMLQKMYNGEYDFWKGGFPISGVDYLDVFSYYISDQGLFHYVDETYDEKYDTALYATSWADRKAAIADLEQYFCENVVDLVVTWPGEYVVYSDKVTGVTVNSLDKDIIYADIAE